MGVVFYCHFPDMLLAKHDSVFRSLYRAPIDYFEQATTGMVGASCKVSVSNLFAKLQRDVLFLRCRRTRRS